MRTDFVRKHAAHAAKIRRSKRQSKKNFVVYYKTVFRKDIEARAKESEESMAQKGKKPLPDDETDTVADIFRRMDEIKEEIKTEVMESVKNK